MVNLQVAWVFESGPRANVAQLSDGSLLDDSFRSLAVIRDIRVADWGMEICQNLSKGGIEPWKRDDAKSPALARRFEL